MRVSHHNGAFVDAHKGIEEASDAHEARDYLRALSILTGVLKNHPGCPLAVFNVASALHMLGRPEEAVGHLKCLVGDQLAATGCLNERQYLSLVMDGEYLMFLAELYSGVFWDSAYNHAERHLSMRRVRRGSAWTKREVVGEIAQLRSSGYGPIVHRESEAASVVKSRRRNQRIGIRLKASRGHPEVAAAVRAFLVWIRRHVEFPIRVPVYLLKSETVPGKPTASASIFLPWNRKEEPYMRIPTGDYAATRRTRGRDNALAGVLTSLAHEIIHYRQWVETGESWEEGVNDRADAIVWRYSKHAERP